MSRSLPILNKQRLFVSYIVENTPAVGQYDIHGPSVHSGAVCFPKEKRFKDAG